MPWRNGLGTTLELRKQDGDGDHGFAWRLSMADVIEDGEFSHFSGYDRTLLLLEGNGLTLDCEGSVARLEHPLQAARFRGEAATFATLHDGPIKDFNVMTLRRLCSAEVTSQAEPAATRIDIDADRLLVYAIGAELQLASPAAAELLLPRNHLLEIELPAKQVLHCAGAAFIAVQIRYNSRA